MTSNALAHIAAQLPPRDALHRLADLFNSMNTPLIEADDWSYLAVSLVRVLTIAMLVLLGQRVTVLVATMHAARPPVTFLALLERGGLGRWQRAAGATVAGVVVIITCLTSQILAGQFAGSGLGHLTWYLLIIYTGLMLLCIGIGLGCGLLTEVVRAELRAREAACSA